MNSIPESPLREDEPAISAVICTHNRAAYLRKAIENLVAQTMAQNKFEILVVDNGSTDATRDVVASFKDAKNLRYLFEPRLGLCRARNTGWRNAKGRYVAYLDDDAVASSGWVAAVDRAFAEHPGAGIVGGRVEPIWESIRPIWISDEIALGLTIVDWPDGPKAISNIDAEWLVGANMAVQRRLLEDVGGFHSKLDRVGSRMISSGDIFLQKKIMQLGYACVYYPDMAVRHVIPASRLTKAWFRRRYYWQGVSDILMLLIEQRCPPVERVRRATRLTAQLIASSQALRSLCSSTDDPTRFTATCFNLIKLGQIAGLLGAARYK